MSNIEDKARIELGDKSINVLNKRAEEISCNYEEEINLREIMPKGVLGETWGLPTAVVTKLIFNKRGSEMFLWRYNSKLEDGYLWIDKKEIVKGKEYHTGFYKQIWPR